MPMKHVNKISPSKLFLFKALIGTGTRFCTENPKI